MSPTVEVCVEFTAGTWTDVTADLVLPSGITITRGRSNQSGSVDPGTCALTLRNNSGQYSPGLTGGAHYPNIVQGKRLRVRVQANGSWSSRFLGYVESWSVPLNDRSGATATCVVSAVDMLGWHTKPLRGRVQEVLEAAGAVAYWPLTETDGTVFAEKLGAGWPNLAARRLSTGGSVDCAQGLPMPGDADQVLKLTPASTTSGYWLEAQKTGNFGAGWTVGMWVGDLPGSPYNSSLTVQQGELWVRATVSWVGATYAAENAHDSEWNYRAPSGPFVNGDTVGAGSVLMLSVSSTAIRLYPDVDEAAPARVSWADDYDVATLRVGWDDYSTHLTSGSMGHVFVIGAALTHAQMATLAADLAIATAYADAELEQVLSWRDETAATVAVLGGQTLIVEQVTAGQTVQGLADTYGQGTGGRFLIARDGTPTWVDQSYRPAQVTVPAYWVDRVMTWQADTSGYVSECTTSLPGGGSYTYRRDNPLRSNAASLTGVRPSDAECATVAQWVVNSTSGDGRIPGAAINLTRLTGADQAAAAAIDVASRLILSDLPGQVPDDQPVIVEGYTEQITPTAWTVSCNLSPDASLATWDDATWDDNYLYAI